MVGEQFKRSPVQLGRREQVVNENAGVHQILHIFFFAFLGGPPSNASRISSGKGASKSSAILMVSPYAPWPRLRPLAGAETGTSRATGIPRLAIEISSPAATRRSNLDNWVLA